MLHVVSLARFKPRKRAIFFEEVEVPDVGFNKAIGGAPKKRNPPAEFSANRRVGYGAWHHGALIAQSR
jgi:hypothetical protein